MKVITFIYKWQKGQHFCELYVVLCLMLNGGVVQ